MMRVCENYHVNEDGRASCWNDSNSCGGYVCGAYFAYVRGLYGYSKSIMEREIWRILDGYDDM